MGVYYNENDERAAAWLRELIRAQVIPDGEVDTRSIVDVQPADLRAFRQCHFFAGIGGWAYALRLAGWPDDRGVWTGSCPCQPWSMAGKGDGADDPRHLWPTWFRLIRECRPDTIFGEQTASLDGRYWLDLVYVDLEGSDYAVGTVDLPACSVGAPHGRQRFWIVADNHGEGRDRVEAPRLHERRTGAGGDQAAAGDVDGASGQHPGKLSGDEGEHDQRGAHGGDAPVAGGAVSVVGDTKTIRRERPARTGRQARHGTERSRDVGDASSARLQGHAGHGDDGHQPGRLDPGPDGSTAAAGGAGFWSDVDWIPCIDGKARPVEPGTFPLAHGIPGRVGLLRGYGNAIVPHVAAEVIRAYLEFRP